MLTVNDKTKQLPDIFNKNAESNNNKLLSMDYDIRADFHNNMVKVFEILDLYKAYYTTLDLYGETVGIQRKGLSDEQYKIAILSKIARNSASTDYNSIIKNISTIFKCNYLDIILENADLPAFINIKKMSIQTIIEVGFTIKQALDIIRSLLPITIDIKEANLEGTFELSDIAEQKDYNKGFGDVSQTKGGYFGTFIVDASKIKGE